MSTYKGAFSSDDLSTTLGEKQPAAGGSISRLGANQGLPREGKGRNFSDSSVLDAPWDLTAPRVPIPESEEMIPAIDDRGGARGFSHTGDFGVLGSRPGRPGRP